MSLTMGTSPFGQAPAGSFNVDVPGRERLLYIEDSPRRVRGYLDGEVVVDSRRVKLLHEHAHLPVWYFPLEDVRQELLEPSDHRTHCPKKGDASYHSVRVGDRVAENAAWHYPEPIEGATAIAGHVAFYFGSLDRWLEEDEEVFVHPRDPYHRVDVLPTTRRVRVSVDGEVLAESSRTRVLFETGCRRAITSRSRTCAPNCRRTTSPRAAPTRARRPTTTRRGRPHWPGSTASRFRRLPS